MEKSVQNVSSSLLSKNLKDSDIQNYNSDCCFLRVRNLVADIEGGMYAEGV